MAGLPLQVQEKREALKHALVSQGEQIDVPYVRAAAFRARIGSRSPAPTAAGRGREPRSLSVQE